MSNWQNWNKSLWNISPAAATYYLDPAAGNDSNAGTSLATAWKTYAKAEQQALTAGQSIAKVVDGQLVLFKYATSGSAQGRVYAYYQTGGGTAGPANPIPLSKVDWSALSHIIHDHCEVNNDGSLNTGYLGMTSGYIGPLITAAHTNGVKVLVNIADIAYEQGGTGSGASYVPNQPSGDPFVIITASPSLLSTFVKNIVNFVLTNGYDGVAIDWEMGVTSIGMLALMSALTPAIKAQNPNLEVNVALASGYALLASKLLSPVKLVDTFTVMCYDLFLTAGQVTWFNSPLYGGKEFTQYGIQQPSCQSIVESFLQLGVPRLQMLLGVPTYGHTMTNAYSGWTGAYVPMVPRQPYQQNYLADSYTPYNTIPAVYEPAYDHWDATAQAPYLGIPGTDPSGDLNTYITFDDPAGLTAKTGFATTEALLGLAIWELNLDYFSARSIVSPLINTIKVSYPKVSLSTVTPSTPAGLTAQNVSTSGLTLNWQVVANATSYVVQRSTTSGSGYTTIATTTAATYTDSGLSSGVTYYYVVAAVNNGTQGSNSAQLAVTATAGSAPAAPTGVSASSAVSNATYGYFSTTLSWSTVSGATSYNIWRSAGVNGASYALIANTASLTYTDATLSPDATWYYVITAVSSTGLESVDSSQVSTATPATYTSPNLIVSPNAINVSPWTLGGTGETATATVITCSTSGDSFLGQLVTVAGSTNYVASITLTVSNSCYVAFGVYTTAWASLGSGSQYVNSGGAVTLTFSFASGSNTQVNFFLDFVSATGTITVANPSIATVLTQIEPNLLTDPSNIAATAAWTVTTGTAEAGNVLQCAATPDAGKNVADLAQVAIPVTPNTYYIATLSAVRTDSSSFQQGAGGYMALSVQGFSSSGYGASLGQTVTALSPGVVVDTYVLFNSGAYSEIVFAFYVTGAAAESATLALTNLVVAYNPYGGLT